MTYLLSYCYPVRRYWNDKNIVDIIWNEYWEYDSRSWISASVYAYASCALDCQV